MVYCQLTELRYSLNGISESQMDLLFSHLDRQESQVIVKRLSNRRTTLSPDDIVLEGMFSNTMIAALARAFPPPLSFKVEMTMGMEQLRRYCAFEWEPQQLLLCGISLLPYQTMQQMISFENAWHYLRLLTTTEAGSILKPMLAVKAKGLVALDRNYAEFILPLHRIDFLLAWLNQLAVKTVDLNWLSGTTGDLDEELLQSVGSIDQTRLPVLNTWVERTEASEDLDFEQLFSRVMVALS